MGFYTFNSLNSKESSVTITLLLFLISLYCNFAYVPLPHTRVSWRKCNVQVDIYQRNRIHVNRCQMISRGDVRNNIEHVSRLLDENKILMSWVLAKKKHIYAGKYANGSVSEHKQLNERFNNLTKKEVELHKELQKLIVIALEQQLGK